MPGHPGHRARSSRPWTRKGRVLGGARSQCQDAGENPPLPLQNRVVDIRKRWEGDGCDIRIHILKRIRHDLLGRHRVQDIADVQGTPDLRCRAAVVRGNTRETALRHDADHDGILSMMYSTSSRSRTRYPSFLSASFPSIVLATSRNFSSVYRACRTWDDFF